MGLSNNIRNHRFKNGEMTQKHLAERVGVSRQTVNAIENSRYAPTINIAIRIADVFRVLVDDLFEYTYDGKPERRPVGTSITPVQAKCSAERAPDEPIEHDEHISKTEGEEDKMTLADLRNLI